VFSISLAGTVATILALAKSGDIATYILLITNGLFDLAVQAGCVTIQANPYQGGDHQMPA
jgi:hypothetical protein